MLQDLLLGKLINNISLTQSIQNSDSVHQKGAYALDATEKNPNIEGTLAEGITKISNKITSVQNTVNSVVALPDGESTASDAEIAAAKVGPKGESYPTLQTSIMGQIEAAKQFSVSNHEPDLDAGIDIWVDSSKNSETIALPEVDDNTVSRTDTWSSYKISKELLAASSSLPSGGGEGGGSINISDIFDDEEVTIFKGWSSQKIQEELLVMKENILASGGGGGGSSSGGSVDILTLLDDELTSINRTWSSQKIKAELDKKVNPSKSLSGYGITDARIENGTIILGNRTITPITSHQDLSGLKNRVTALEEKVNKEIIRGTLPAGETTITISDNSITTDSVLSFYTSIYGVNPKKVSTEAGSVTLEFKAQTEDMEVGVSVDA